MRLIFWTALIATGFLLLGWITINQFAECVGLSGDYLKCAGYVFFKL